MGDSNNHLALRKVNNSDRMKGTLLGPEYSNEEIESSLKKFSIRKKFQSVEKSIILKR